MTTYYVGTGGNDSNNGTTWALRKLTLNGAEDIPVAAGDTVYVGAGTYRETLTVDVSGSSGSPSGSGASPTTGSGPCSTPASPTGTYSRRSHPAETRSAVLARIERSNGIDGPGQGHFYVDPFTGKLTKSKSAYEHPQPHACFIQGVGDDLVNEGGIMDLWVREARLFKYGSGTGSNFSMLRGEGERLSILSGVRAKPAVPFAGKYRIIDFTLSNCVNSDINDVIVLTQYKSHSLDRHVTQPAWSPDGRHLYFLLEDDRSQYLARMPSAGGAIVSGYTQSSP